MVASPQPQPRAPAVVPRPPVLSALPAPTLLRVLSFCDGFSLWAAQQVSRLLRTLASSGGGLDCHWRRLVCRGRFVGSPEQVPPVYSWRQRWARDRRFSRRFLRVAEPLNREDGALTVQHFTLLPGSCTGPDGAFDPELAARNCERLDPVGSVVCLGCPPLGPRIRRLRGEDAERRALEVLAPYAMPLTVPLRELVEHPGRSGFPRSIFLAEVTFAEDGNEPGMNESHDVQVVYVVTWERVLRFVADDASFDPF
eukprot:TRINITY_DN11735_c0_g1_i1.p1 TRINITY_DN11735_c0_g1~~TRINITY_DN11735_c0_g1_i1.p1  ORF type:complete len:284 (+),score=32.72 TRINITY_DN11735_c0_g1_i1:91-852(+)